ncbi:lysozyme inhibitor LprI family protein [Neorhizobium tomejilense]|uniref:lysozyme inhibitor LprI family protein n=1 Tax=Neorhizobium tomejilense TaxID=2093828 RepID=UPI003ECC6E86
MRRFTIAIALTSLLVGLTLSGSPRTATAASFDCERANLAADEKVICDTRTLNDADVKMVTTFDILTSLMAMGNRGKLQDEQSAWLKRRQACGEDVECLRAAYGERLKQLDEAYKNLNRPL